MSRVPAKTVRFSQLIDTLPVMRESPLCVDSVTTEAGRLGRTAGRYNVARRRRGWGGNWTSRPLSRAVNGVRCGTWLTARKSPTSSRSIYDRAPTIPVHAALLTALVGCKAPRGGVGRGEEEEVRDMFVACRLLPHRFENSAIIVPTRDAYWFYRAPPPPQSRVKLLTKAPACSCCSRKSARIAFEIMHAHWRYAVRSRR